MRSYLVMCSFFSFNCSLVLPLNLFVVEGLSYISFNLSLVDAEAFTYQMTGKKSKHFLQMRT